MNGNRSPRERKDEAQRLGEAWNARVRRDPIADPNFDPDLLAAIDRLTTMDATKAPRGAFVHHLSERLMDTTAPRSMPLPRYGRLTLPRLPAHRRILPLLTVVAVVLLVVTLIGQSFFFGGGGPPSTAIPAAFAALNGATPTAPPADATAFGDVEGPNNQRIGTAILGGPEFDLGPVASPYHATMTSWTLAAGKSVEITAKMTGAAPAVAIDFVISGAARMTFDGPVAASQSRRLGLDSFSYWKSGDSVELERGDTVVYRYDQPHRITNAFMRSDLQVVTVILTSGDAKQVLPSTPSFSPTVLSEGKVVVKANSANPEFYVSLFVWNSQTMDPMPALGGHSVYAIPHVPVDSTNACFRYFNLIVDDAPRG